MGLVVSSILGRKRCFMGKPSGIKRISFEPGQEQWPVFWCWLLRPLLNGDVAPGGIGSFLSDLASTTFVFPDGRRGKPSRATLWRKWTQYRDGGFEALFRKQRSDRGQPRKAAQAMIARAIELKKEQPYRSDLLINQFLQAEFGRTVPKSTLLHHLNRAGATRLKLVDRRQKQETAKCRWERDEKWLAKLARSKFTEAELLAGASQHLRPEDVATLLKCVREQPSHYRDRAAAVLSHSNEVPIPHIMAFFGVSRASVYRWIHIYEKHGVQVLLRNEFPGRGRHNKVKDQEYTNAVFEILHAPPSIYGINRTTWRLKDLASIMTKRSLPISRSAIARIVEDAVTITVKQNGC
jgi:transposase